MARRSFKESITVRRELDFGLESDQIPTAWLDQDIFKSRLFDAVQATFPDGERYFISAVRQFKDRIKDPKLKKAVRDFMGQEGQHGKLHAQYNDRLKNQGIAIDAFTKHTRRISEARLKRYSPEYNLALTAAYEHFTAMMAELFFAEKQTMAGADPRIRGLFAWHAIEEMEHRDVAFDVLQKVADVGYAKRTLAMTHATTLFTFYMMVSTWAMLGMDGYSRGERARMYARHLPWLFGPRRGVLSRLLPMIASYYRPGFHPSHKPTVHNYQQWLETFIETGDPMQAAEAMYAAAS